MKFYEFIYNYESIKLVEQNMIKFNSRWYWINQTPLICLMMPHLL